MVRHAAAQHIIDLAKLVLLAQGSLALAFGLAAMFWPGITAMALAYLFAVFLLADGSILIILGLAWREHGARSRVMWGLLQVLLGLFVLYNPDVTFSILIMILGVTLMVRGVFNISHALFWKHEPSHHRVMHAVLGMLGLIVGTVVAFQPAAGGLAFVWVLGLYALVTGTLLIALALGGGQPARHNKRSTHAG